MDSYRENQTSPNSDNGNVGSAISVNFIASILQGHTAHRDDEYQQSKDFRTSSTSYFNEGPLVSNHETDNFNNCATTKNDTTYMKRSSNFTDTISNESQAFNRSNSNTKDMCGGTESNAEISHYCIKTGNGYETDTDVVMTNAHQEQLLNPMTVPDMTKKHFYGLTGNNIDITQIPQDEKSKFEEPYEYKVSLPYDDPIDKSKLTSNIDGKYLKKTKDIELQFNKLKFERQHITTDEINSVNVIAIDNSSFIDQTFSPSFKIVHSLNTLNVDDGNFSPQFAYELENISDSTINSNIVEASSKTLPYKSPIDNRRTFAGSGEILRVKTINYNRNTLKARGRKPSTSDDDETKLFPCKYCDGKFGKMGHLKRHILSLHMKRKPFHCNVCDIQFSRSDNFSKHLKTSKHLKKIVRMQDDVMSQPK